MRLYTSQTFVKVILGQERMVGRDVQKAANTPQAAGQDGFNNHWIAPGQIARPFPKLK